MPAAPFLFERIRALSAFDSDARAALVAMHAHFSADFPGCSLALLLVRDQGAGRCRLTGLIGPDGREHVPNADPNNDRNAAPLFDDALTARLFADERAQVLSLPPPERHAPLAQALFTPAAVLAIPVANSGLLTHWLVFGSTVPRRFEHVDIERLLLHGNLAASLIVRPIALRALTVETRRQREEIESLADIQKLLLPGTPDIVGLDYAVHWQPAATAAGDYYEMSNLTPFAPPDFVANGADLWGVIVGDVSGHGVAAAAEAVQFDAIMRTYRGDGGETPAAAISYANRYFFSRRNRGHFMTVFAMVYRPDTRQLRYLSAGHPPLLHRRGRDVNALGEGDQIPLGVLRDYQYHNNEVTAASGDLFVLYTDGIIEARDERGAEFGVGRLRELVALAPEDSAQALCNVVVEAVQAHQGGPLGSDDQTLLVLRVAH
jgi:sigma-B regulation protein RsbU (phosphoserine phosphatase)